MAFTLNQVVPWGRSLEEYVAMFALSEADLARSILGCGDGPAAFNASLSGMGGQVISVDPLYQYTAEDVRRRIRETYADIMEQMRRNRHEFIWTHIPSVDELGRLRMAAMEAFLADFPLGLRQGRYVNAELPGLPFAGHAFDLALCSHFLFLYSKHLDEEFHIASVREMCRVAGEVRIFPLLDLDATQSRHLQAVIDRLSASGYAVAVESVAYEFQQGGNKMLRIWRVASGGRSSPAVAHRP